MDLTLQIDSGPGELGPDGFEQFSLSPGETMTIGRSPDADWVLVDESRHLSSLHCIVEGKEDGFFLTDRSTNGTFFNDEELRCSGPRKLSPGDTLRMGPYRLSVLREETVETEPLPEQRKAEVMPIAVGLAAIASIPGQNSESDLPVAEPIAQALPEPGLQEPMANLETEARADAPPEELGAAPALETTPEPPLPEIPEPKMADVIFEPQQVHAEKEPEHKLAEEEPLAKTANAKPLSNLWLVTEDEPAPEEKVEEDLADDPEQHPKPESPDKQDS